MIDWHEHWTRFPRKFADDDFRRQVARTVNGGVPIPVHELDIVVDEVAAFLRLGPNDRLLDLCCGNGLLSAKLAERCGEVVGVDFSESMIGIARLHHARENVEYIEGSVLELGELVDRAFDKVCMIESLAYFSPDDLASILRGIALTGPPHSRVLFSGVLDEEAKWSFFDTPERRESYEQQRKEGKEIMGTWWTPPEIRRIAVQHGYGAEFFAQDERLNTSHYRFNAVLTPRPR